MLGHADSGGGGGGGGKSHSCSLQRWSLRASKLSTQNPDQAQMSVIQKPRGLLCVGGPNCGAMQGRIFI